MDYSAYITKRKTAGSPVGTAIAPTPVVSEEPAEQTAAPSGGFFSNMARYIAKTPLKAVGTAQAAIEATGQLITGQGAKASQTIRSGSERMRATEKALGYQEGEIATPYSIAKQIEIKDGKMTGGEFGKETLDVIGAGAELASYGMGLPAAGRAAGVGVAGKALTKVPLGKLMFQTAKAEGIAGAVGQAGTAMQEENTSLGNVLGQAAIGGTIGAVAGAALPALGRGYKSLKSWSQSADEAVETALRGDKPLKATDWSKGVPKEMKEPKLTKPLSEIDDDLFPDVAPDAVGVSEPLRKKAKKTGLAEGRIQTIGEMSQAEKRAGLEMYDMAENRELNELAEHPETVVVRPAMTEFNTLKSIRKESGEALDGLVEEMPDRPIALSEPISALDSWLDKNGITVAIDYEKGANAVDFSGSKYRGMSASDRKAIQQVVDELRPVAMNGQAVTKTPKEIRTIRQVLRETVENNKKATEPFSDGVSRMISGLREELNKPLAGLSKKYEAANKQYAITSTAMERFLKFAGSNFNEEFLKGDGEIAASRMVELLRRSMGAAPARANAEFKALSNAAAKVGLPPQAVSDPRRLAYLGQTLEDLFHMPKETSFRSQVGKGVGEGLEKASAAMDVAAHPMNPMVWIKNATTLFKGDQRLKARQYVRQILSEGLEEGGEKVAPKLPKPPKTPKPPKASPKAKAAAPAKTAVNTTDETLYHGTADGVDFENFDLEKAGSGVGSNFYDQGDQIYLTETESAAKYFADLANQRMGLKNDKIVPSGGGSVLKFKLKPDAKIKEINKMPRGLDTGDAQKVIDQARKEGYDAVRFPDEGFETIEGSKEVFDELKKLGRPPKTTIVLNPNKLTKAAPAETTLYRGGKPFDVSKVNQNGEGVGSYFSSDKSVAQKYASKENGGVVHEAQLSKDAKVVARKDLPKRFLFDYEGGEIKDLDHWQELYGKNKYGEQDAMALWAKENGYDAVQMSKDNFIVLNPNKLTKAAPAETVAPKKLPALKKFSPSDVERQGFDTAYDNEAMETAFQTYKRLADKITDFDTFDEAAIYKRFKDTPKMKDYKVMFDPTAGGGEYGMTADDLLQTFRKRLDKEKGPPRHSSPEIPF